MGNIKDYKKLLLENVELTQKQEEAKRLAKKWTPTGLLDGLDEHGARNMATLLESQAKQLITESTITNAGGSGNEEWSNVALPLVRRVFGKLSVKDVISTQPMTLPSGFIFYLDFKYGSGAQPGFTKGYSVFGGDLNDDGTAGLFGRTNGINGGFYGDGRFGYTSNDYSSGSLTAAVTSASWADVKYSASLSASAAADTIKKVALTLGGDIDPDAVANFKPTSASANVTYYPAYTSFSASGNNYVVTFLVAGTSASIVAGTDWAVKYIKMPTESARGDFEDLSISGSFQSLDIPELDMQIKRESIVAKTKKLKTIWSMESAQDINAYQAVDVQSELTDMMYNFVSTEIDLELLEMLLHRAKHEDFWSAKIGYAYNGSNAFVAAGDPYAQAFTQGEWFQTLGTKINKMANKIYQATMVGTANFIQCSPLVATILESIPGFQVDTTGGEEQFGAGVTKVGTLSKRFTIYKNPYMVSNVMLVGYKGKTFFETGAVYAPYTPLATTPLIYDPTNFTPRLGLSTRYGKKVVKPEMYGKIWIHGLETI